MRMARHANYNIGCDHAETMGNSLLPSEVDNVTNNQD